MTGCRQCSLSVAGFLMGAPVQGLVNSDSSSLPACSSQAQAVRQATAILLCRTACPWQPQASRLPLLLPSVAQHLPRPRLACSMCARQAACGQEACYQPDILRTLTFCMQFRMLFRWMGLYFCLLLNFWAHASVSPMTCSDTNLHSVA